MKKFIVSLLLGFVLILSSCSKSNFEITEYVFITAETTSFNAKVDTKKEKNIKNKFIEVIENNKNDIKLSTENNYQETKTLTISINEFEKHSGNTGYYYENIYLVEYAIFGNMLTISTLRKEIKHNVTIITTKSTEKNYFDENVNQYIYGLYYDDESNEYVLDFKPKNNDFLWVKVIQEFAI